MVTSSYNYYLMFLNFSDYCIFLCDKIFWRSILDKVYFGKIEEEFLIDSL